jgi:hypothetical protein
MKVKLPKLIYWEAGREKKPRHSKHSGGLRFYKKCKKY